jgi:hypothetical protein
MWFLILIRELPRRFGRLLGTVFAPPAQISLAMFVYWIHALLWYAFDLLAGPEVCQIFLRLATDTRPLTKEEISAAAEVLGPKAIRYRDVRIAQRGILTTIFGLNKGRAFATWYTINMPEGKDHDQALLVHEMTHTYQFERTGSVYIGQGLWVQRRLGRKAYDYGGPAGLQASWAAGKHYKDYNREQQGQIAQDYCALVISDRETAAYEPFIAELQQGLV